MIAALYVEKNGCYFGLEGVDPWDEARDARIYDGPYPIVAHPPCQRWGNFWRGGTHPTSKRYDLGDDGGCFEAALSSVRKWGGVIEHPAGSRAWKRFQIMKPTSGGGWVRADLYGGWTCEIDQGSYGHRARKKTWLYVYGTERPQLKWGRAEGDFMLLRAVSKARMKDRGIKEQKPVIARKECLATPEPFRDLLIEIAKTVHHEQSEPRPRGSAPHQRVPHFL